MPVTALHLQTPQAAAMGAMNTNGPEAYATRPPPALHERRFVQERSFPLQSFVDRVLATRESDVGNKGAHRHNRFRGCGLCSSSLPVGASLYAAQTLARGLAMVPPLGPTRLALLQSE